MKADPVLKLFIFLLVAAGFFILTSASIGLAAKRDLPFYHYVLRQLVFGGITGVIALIAAYKIPYKSWRRFALPIFIFAILLGALVLIPSIGFEHNGARRWIVLGPINFQPSEFLKFGLLVYLSTLFAARKQEIGTIEKGVLPLLLVLAIAGILVIAEPDVGTFGIMFLSSLLLFIVAGGRLKHVVAIILLGILLLGTLIALKPYRFERFRAFLDRDYDTQKSGYQINQARIAIGSGGLFGRGFGLSRQKFEYLPEATGDSIFAVAAEEFGFVGSVILIFLFLLFAWRGFYISSQSPDAFGKIFGSGIVILILTQSFLNIAAMSGLLPLTGVPLVFVSQGGSSLAVTLLEAGILLNISRTRA